MKGNKIIAIALILLTALSFGSQRSEARSFALNLPLIYVDPSGNVSNGKDSLLVQMYYSAPDDRTNFSLPRGIRAPRHLFIAYGCVKNSREIFGVVANEEEIPGEALYVNGWLATVLAVDREEALRVASNIYGCIYYRRWYSPSHRRDTARSSHNPME